MARTKSGLSPERLREIKAEIKSIESRLGKLWNETLEAYPVAHELPSAIERTKRKVVGLLVKIDNSLFGLADP